jgi:hypothetical protein
MMEGTECLGASYSNLGRPVKQGEVVQICQWAPAATENEYLVREALDPETPFISATLDGMKADLDTTFVVVEVAGGRALLGTKSQPEVPLPFIGWITTTTLRHPPEIRVGDIVMVLNEYFSTLDNEEKVRNLPLLFSSGEVKGFDGKNVHIFVFYGHGKIKQFHVPKTYVVTRREIQLTANPIGEMMGEIREKCKPPEGKHPRS